MLYAEDTFDEEIRVYKNKNNSNMSNTMKTKGRTAFLITFLKQLI